MTGRSRDAFKLITANNNTDSTTYLGLEVFDAGQTDLAVAAVGATCLLLDLVEGQTAAW